IPAHGVLKEFERALKEIKDDPKSIPIWQTVVAKYHPTFIGECKNAIDWSTEIVTEWLESNMFDGISNAKELADKVVEQLGSHEDTKTHARHIHIDEAKSFGLKIKSLETDFKNNFQDLILTIHHAYMHTFANSTAIRIVENHLGNAIVFNLTK
ncbi:MAG: hypothetical protein Q7T83_00800, partial [Thermodesulfovibrionales bacterium]|nr:hypothetical protein [Thermodesulfovibrionales bacterium]